MNERRRNIYRRTGDNFYFLGRPAEVWRKAIDGKRPGDHPASG